MLLMALSIKSYVISDQWRSRIYLKKEKRKERQKVDHAQAHITPSVIPAKHVPANFSISNNLICI